MTTSELPSEGQRVDVRIGTGGWQPATFRRGQFIDVYGLALDPGRISEWQATPVTPPDGNGAVH